MSNKVSSTGGVGFLTLLALIFIGLKLAQVGVVAQWSWWAVLAPLWVPWLVLLCVGIPAFIVYAVVKVWRR